MKWISLKDKIPNPKIDGEKVLLYRTDINQSQELMSISVNDTIYIKHCEKETTYWMQLPKPPNQNK
jgi:hypothetical protein